MYEVFESLLRDRGLSVAEFSRQTGIPKSALSEWKTGKYKNPRPDRLRQIAEFFGVSVDYLMTGEAESGHYTDPVTAELAERMKDDHDLRLLFSAAKDARPETLQAVYDVLLALKKREKGDET